MVADPPIPSQSQQDYRDVVAEGFDPVAGSRILFDRRADKAAWECQYDINCACTYAPEGIECLMLDCLRPPPKLAR